MRITSFENREILSLISPAKLNLFFEVLAKREDGFHSIVSVAVPIRIFDRLTFEPNQTGKITFHCTGNSKDVPGDENNIAVKAVKKVQERFHIPLGVNITLQKTIPSQAGLGGGSSDAAAAVRLANRAWKINAKRKTLISLAAELGSDCPLFFYDSPTLSTGRGEIIKKLPKIKPLWFVVWKPAEGLSTAAVYKECMPLHDGNFQNPALLLDALQTGKAETVGKFLFNRLEIPARKLWTRFDSIKKDLTDAGCIAAQMSGSGTSFFGLCYNKAHAEKVAAALPTNEKVFVVKSL